MQLMGLNSLCTAKARYSEDPEIPDPIFYSATQESI